MSEVTAWLLDLGHDLYAAIGERELIHLLPDPPDLQAIPQSPPYCRQVLVWEGEVLPLMSLARRIRMREAKQAEERGLIAITAFQGHSETTQCHGALLLAAPPVRIQVHDAQACALPEPKLVWQRLAIACFEHPERGATPVLDLARIFLLPAVRIGQAGAGYETQHGNHVESDSATLRTGEKVCRILPDCSSSC